ncbi:MAG: OprD family outer membrane porin [Desulfobacula sp.]|nr:OprD family outer membrane porin [Desulfobacula sp.]
MKNSHTNIKHGILLLILITTLVLALYLAGTLSAKENPKRILRNNGTEKYNLLPEKATAMTEVFAKGVLYGRLRMNSFKFYWDDDSKYNPKGFGIGGAFVYKTAPLNGISATAGFYTSQNIGLLNDNDALFGKAGKGTFSRYDKLQDGDWGMSVLAQAYLQYHFSQSDIKIGRQIFESFLTKSNDTKMIPNTFEGLSLASRDLPETSIKLAYLTRQKLRDHTKFHDVITYNDGRGNAYSNWNNNDDSAVHKGLSYTNLTTAGKDTKNDLIVAGATNTSVENLKLDVWYTGVPDLFYSIMGEVNYKIPMIDGWILTPGFRYMGQFDDGAGAIGGAALNGTLAGTAGSAKGYDDAGSVDGHLYAARLLLKKGPGSLLAGYSKISDDADIIAPWRGYPTGGYSRSMAQYNWEADTESWMIKTSYDFGKAGLLSGFRASLDYVYMDYDDTKEQLGGIGKTDRSIIHADMWYKFMSFPGLEAKFRMGLVDAQNTSAGADPSYNEYRLELNYLF